MLRLLAQEIGEANQIVRYKYDIERINGAIADQTIDFQLIKFRFFSRFRATRLMGLSHHGSARLLPFARPKQDDGT